MRPSRAWFVVAGLVLLVSVGIGAALITYAILAGTGSRDTVFRPGQTVTASLTPGSAIYITDDAYGISCRVSTLSGQTVPTSDPGYSFETTSNGRNWVLAELIHVPSAGQYRVACTGDGLLAVGEKPKVGRFAGGLVGGILISLAGILVTVVIAIVTGVRRGSHRRRLQAQRMGPPPPPYQY